MKRALLLFLIALTTSPGITAAAEWVKIHTATDQNQYFYDSSKLFLNNDEITYWKKVTFKSPQSFKDKLIASGLYRERIHCVEHTLKLISYLLYSPEGDLSEYTPSKEGDAAPIIPDSLGDVFERALCPLVLQEKQDRQKKEEAKQQAEAKIKAEAEEKAKLKAETGANTITPPPPVTPMPATSVPQD